MWRENEEPNFLSQFLESEQREVKNAQVGCWKGDAEIPIRYSTHERLPIIVIITFLKCNMEWVENVPFLVHILFF